MHDSCSPWEQSMQFKIQILNDNIKDLAINKSCILLDTYTEFGGYFPVDTLYANDGLHLSIHGYNHWINNLLLPFCNSFDDSISFAMFGNSITNGIDYLEFGNNNPNLSNWAYLLKRDVQNHGVGGDRTDDLLNRINDVKNSNAHIVFLLIGINDLYGGIPTWVIIENIEKIIDELEKNNQQVILQTVMPILL